MAAPPPKNDQETSAITFGIAAMDEHLEGAELDFPASREDILSAIGNRPVAYDPQGNTMTLAAAFEHVDQRTFASRRELLNALHPVFETKRKQSGFGGWLKTIFPF